MQLANNWYAYRTIRRRANSQSIKPQTGQIAN